MAAILNTKVVGRNGHLCLKTKWFSPGFDSSIVDQDIDAAVGLFDKGCHGSDAFRIIDV